MKTPFFGGGLYLKEFAVWVKREINLHEADRPASASTHDEVPDIG
jgi:hypothetical protein